MTRMGEARSAMGISMREAARRMGFNYGTYYNYEKGLREPKIEDLIRIADFYGCTIDWLVRGDDDAADEGKPVAPVFSVTPKEYELVCSYREADKDLKLIVDTTLRQTKKKRPTPAGASAGQELYTAQMVAKDGAENTLFTVERNLGNEIYRKAVEIADSDKRDV